MKIAISGHGRCGKDTAAEYLSTISHLKYEAGTSYWARHIVFDRMKWKGFEYKDADECWRDRHDHRIFWAKVIGEYNRDDPTRLYRDCLQNQSILTGVRLTREMEAIKREGLVDLWVWIERKMVPKDPTMEFGPDSCDIIIPNNGTLGEFQARLKNFAGVLNPFDKTRSSGTIFKK